MRNRDEPRDCPSRKTMLKAHQERIPQTSPTSRIHLHDHCHINSQENTDWPTPPPPPEIQGSPPRNTTKCAAMPNTTLSEHFRPIHHQSFQSTVLILESCAKTLSCAFHLSKYSIYLLVLLYVFISFWYFFMRSYPFGTRSSCPCTMFFLRFSATCFYVCTSLICSIFLLLFIVILLFVVLFVI